ncbi:MAG: helix-turn-helix transcriptional regulator [Prevotella sp.]
MASRGVECIPKISLAAKAICQKRKSLSVTSPPFSKKSVHLRSINLSIRSPDEGANQIKIVLAEKQGTIKWLAEQLDKGEAAISKWCTNRAQPPLETIVLIANVLQVDVKDLLRSTVQESNVVYIKIPKSKL